MAADIAQLGFSVDLRGLLGAERQLDRVDEAGRRVERSGGLISRSMGDAGRSASASGGLISRSMGNASSSIDRTTRSGSNMSSMFGKLSGVLGGLGLLAIAKNAVTMGNAFDTSMNTVQSKLLITTDQMKGLRDQAKELGAVTAFSASQAADGMGYLAQAGLSAEQIMGAMPATLNLASAAGMDLAKSADIATNVMGAFKLQVSDLPAITDVLALTSAKANTSVEEMASAIKQAGPIAQGFGVSIYETSAALGQLANNGFKGEQAGMIFKNMLSNLANPAGETKKALKELGLTQSDVFQKTADGSLKFLGMSNMLDKLKTSGASTTDMIRIFGAEAGPGLISLVGSGEAIDTLEQNIRKSGAAAEMAAIQMQGLPGVIKSLSSAWESVNIAFMEMAGSDIAISGLTKITEALRWVVSTAKDAATEWAFFKDDLQFSDDAFFVALRGIGDAIQNIGANLAPVLPFLAEFATGAAAIVASALGLGAVASAFGFIGTAISAMGAILLANPIVATIAAIGGAAYVIRENWEPIKAWWNDFWSVFSGPAEKAWSDLKTTVVDSEIAQSIKLAWADVPDYIKEPLNQMADKVSETWNHIQSTVEDQGYVQGGMTLITEYANFVIGTFQSMPDYAAQAWTDIQSIISDSQIVSGALVAWEIFRSTFLGILFDVKAGAVEVFSSLVTAFSYVGSDVSGIVSELSQTLAVWMDWWSGESSETMIFIRDVYAVGWDWIKGIVSGAWDILKVTIKTGWDFISGILTVGLRILRGDWAGAWDGMKSTVIDFGLGIFNILETINDKIAGFIGRIKSAISDAATSVRGFFGLADEAGEAGQKIAGGFVGPMTQVKAGLDSTIESSDKLSGSFIGNARAALEGMKAGIAHAEQQRNLKQMLDDTNAITIKVTEGTQQAQKAVEQSTVATIANEAANKAGAVATKASAQETLKKSAIDKQAEAFIKANMSAQDKYNAVKNQGLALLAAEKITQEQYNTAIDKAQAALDKSTAAATLGSTATVKLTQAQKDAAKATEALNTAQQKINDLFTTANNKHAVLTATLNENSAAGRVLELQQQSLHEGTKLLTEAKAKELQGIEASNKAIENQIKVRNDLAQAVESAIKSEKESGQSLEIARQAIRMTDEELQALTLSYKVGYTKELANSEAANNAQAKSLQDQRAAYIAVQKTVDDMHASLDKQILSLTGASDEIRQNELDLKKITGTERAAIIAKQDHITEIKAQQKLMDAGKAIFEATRTDAEKLKKETELLKEIHEAGGIEADTYQRKIKLIKDQYDPASKAAKTFANESKKLADEIEILEAKLYGNEDAARAAELGQKGLNKSQTDGLVVLENYRDGLTETEKGLVALEEAAKKTGESITNSLTDAFLSGDFKSIGSSLVDIFKNDIAKPILENVFKPLSESISNSFSGIGNSISNSLGQGNLFGTTGTGGGIMSTLSGGGWQGALMGGGLGMMAGQAFGQSGIGSGIGGAIGSIWGPIGTAIGTGLGGLVESLFSSGPQEITGRFGSFGSVVQEQQSIHNRDDRTFYQTGRSDRTFQRTSELGQFGILHNGSVSIGRDDPKQIEGIHAALDAMQKLDAVAASFLPAATIDRIKTGLDGFEANALNTAQLTKKRLTIIYKNMDVELRKAFQGGENVMAGTAEEIAARFAYIAQINDAQFVPAMEKMGWNLGNTETKALAAAVGLTDAAGGLDQLKSGLESYYAVVFTKLEQQELEKATAQAALDAFNAANNAHITSIESFREHVEGLNKQTQTGQAATAAALELTSSIASLYGTAEEAAQAAQQQSDANNQLTDSATDATGSVNNASDALSDAAAAAQSVTAAYESAMQAERDRAYEIEYGTDALKQRQLLESGWTQQMVDNLYALKDANTAAQNAADAAANSSDDLSLAIDQVGSAANEATYDVAGLRDSISSLVTQLYSPIAQGEAEIDAAQARLTNLQNQYSAEQERISGLNEAAQAAYSTEVERVNDLNSAAQDAYNTELSRINDLNSANESAYREQLAQHESLKNAAYDLRGFIDDWRGTLDSGDVTDNLHELQKQFNAAADLAASGDLGAAQDAQGLAASLRGLYGEIYGSGNSVSQLADNQIMSRLEFVADALDAAAGSTPTAATVISGPSSPVTIDGPTRPAEIESTVLASLQSQITAQQNLIASLSAANETAETEANRQALALELATKIGELGLALDESVFDLLRENGIAIDALAADFGIDVAALRQSVESIGTSITSSVTAQTDSAALIPYLSAIESANDTSSLRTAVYDLLGSNGQAITDLKTAFGVDVNNLNVDTLAAFDSLADALHIDTVTMSNLLGADIDVLGDVISDKLSSLPDVPNDIKTSLAPYLTAITNANDTTSLQSALASLQTHVDSLPPGIQAQLNTQLQGIVGNTSGTITAVAGMNSANISALDALADALQVDTVSLAAELGADLDILGNQIAANLSSQSASMPNDIRSGLAPYLAAIEASNDTASLQIAVSALEGHIDSLPADIKAKLNAQLSGIVGNTSGITGNLLSLISSNKSAMESVADSLGIDVADLKLSVENIGANITSSVSSQTDSSALIPYLTAIESANDTSSLRAAVYDLLGSNGRALTDLKSAFNVDISQLNADTIRNFDSLADALHIDTLTLSTLLGADFDDLKTSISGNLSALPNLSRDIRAGLAPYLSDIETANDTGALQTALASLQNHVDSLPPSIQAQLNNQLDGIVGNTSGTISAVSLMNGDNITALNSLASALQTDTVSLAAELGADLDVLGNQIAAYFAAQTTALPADIQTGLAPYLSAIETSNDPTTLQLAIAALQGRVDLLPPAIRDPLNSTLAGIVGNTDGITENLTDLISSNEGAISALADSFGVDVGVLQSATEQSSADNLAALANLSADLSTDFISLASTLGADFDTLGDSISANLATMPNIPNDIKTGLAPFLTAIKDANDPTSLRNAINAVTTAVNTVPSATRSQLSAHLNAITNSNNPASTVNAVNALRSYINSLPSAIKGQLDPRLLSIASSTAATNSNAALTAGRTNNVYSAAISGRDWMINVRNEAKGIQTYINGLPPNIKAQLNAQLNSMIGNTSNTITAANNTRYAVNSATNAIAANTSETRNTTIAANNTRYAAIDTKTAVNTNTNETRNTTIAANNTRYAAIDTKTAVYTLMQNNGHLWSIRQNIASQNNNWSKSGSANIPSYKVGSDSVPGGQNKAFPVNLHGGEMVFDYAQSGSLRDKVLANMSIVPAAMAMLKRAANEPKFVKQEISIAPQKVSGGNNDEVVRELRAIKTELTEAKRELKELKEDQKRSQFVIARDNKRTAETLDDWNRNGMPAEEEAA